MYLILIIIVISAYANCLDNGLARTPPMGWLSWERFTCTIDCVKYPRNCINAQLYKDMADRIVADGFKDVGYKYINIDDCWSEKERDTHTHRLIHDKKRFPNGIKALADYVHSKGLKLGIYGDVGPKTCANYPAQNGPGEGYFEIDADTFAEWKIDSFKFDGCNEDYHNFDVLYPRMERALNSTGRKILYSCEWPLYLREHMKPNYATIAKTCNLYRNYRDVYDIWDSIGNIIDDYGNNSAEYSKYNGPGNWFDPDMLVIGNYGLSLDQSRAQMAMWSIWSAPLYMSNDLRHLCSKHKKILQNKKIIAINQDPRGIMGKRILKEKNNLEIWVKPVDPKVNGIDSYAVVYLSNRIEGQPIYHSHSLKDILPSSASHASFTVHDLFEDGSDSLGELNYNESLNLLVNPSHGVRMVKLIPNN